MDRRQKKTRKAIYNAFVSLLERKSYSNISVQDIIDGADVGRSTFYSHFETKDELLRTMATDIFEHVFAHELDKEKTHDFSDEKGFDKKITHILYHLSDNRATIKRILSCESSDLFIMYLKQYLFDAFSENMITNYPDIPKEYILDQRVCSFAETVRWWFLQDEDHSPEEITEFYLKVNAIPF